VMGGEEAFHRLRAIRPDVEIILTSGYDQSQALEGFPESHAAVFLQKPYTGEELASKVRSTLGGHAAAVSE